MVPTKKRKKKKKVLVVAEGCFRDEAELRTVVEVSGRGAGGRVVGCRAGWVDCHGPGDVWWLRDVVVVVVDLDLINVGFTEVVPTMAAGFREVLFIQVCIIIIMILMRDKVLFPDVRLLE